MLIGRSPVRISFGGGGTDLPSYYEQFGGVVLSTAINKYFYTILGNRTDGRIQVISSDLRLFGNWSDVTCPTHNNGLEIPLAVLKDLGATLAADLFLASEIPPGTGLGSSASVCVNLLKVLTTYLRRPLSKYDLAERAFNITRVGLGRHVGKQDEYAASFGGLNFICFDRDGETQVETLHLDSGVLSTLQSNLMLFFTGSAHHSWDILAEQEKSTRLATGPAVEALH
jgi:D-glycero-alpha-D-manno-heptose-7-phosphate kinase